MSSDFCACIWKCLERQFNSSFYLWHRWLWESRCRKSVGYAADPTRIWIPALFLTNFMGLGKDFSFLKLSFSIYKIRPSVPTYLTRKLWWSPSLPCLCKLKCEMTPRQVLPLNPSIAHVVWDCPSLCRGDFFSHSSLHSPFTLALWPFLAVLFIASFSVHVTAMSNRYHVTISESLWSVMYWVR